MYKHILVPLDGSKLAEIVLPTVAFLAEKLEARVTLFHVLEKDASPTIHGDRHLTREDEARAYLEEMAKTSFPPSARVDFHVHTNAADNVADSLVEHAHELHPDLIIMCTHGGGGLRDLMTGSVAQQVIARSIIPIMLVKPLIEEGMALDFSDMLVALDGNPDHEEGLTAAVALGLEIGSTLTLINVVPTYGTLRTERAAVGRLLPTSTALMLDMLEEEALKYLREIGDRCCSQGVNVKLIVERGEPVEEIVGTAGRLKSDLIVIGTHGKSGLEAFWSGSTGAQIITSAKTSILLVPARAG